MLNLRCLYQYVKLNISAFGILITASVTCDHWAWGQVANDNTLGSENSRVTSPKPKNFQIDGGATRGTNLFHSFSQFSVPNNGTTYFNNAPNIQNIISRVTGGSVSNIDGLIKTKHSANLFLLNPTGIIFGPNAKLDIGGSFLASSAPSLVFKDGIKFSATDTQSQPLLTVNVPTGLQLGNNPSALQIQGSNLKVEPNQNLVMVGGNLSLERGKLTAPGGRIELGGLSAPGEVGINENGSLNFPNNVARADVSLMNGTIVNVRAGGGGFVTINARDFKVMASELLAGIGKNLGIPKAQAGDVEINALNTVSLNASTIQNQVAENAKGNAGQVIIRAGDTIYLADRSFINNRVEKSGVGNSGGITISAGTLSLDEASGLTATTAGTGNAGAVIIRASDTISLADGSFINSRVARNGVGNSGGIDIRTEKLSLTDKASLNANTDGTGNAGAVIIRAGKISLVDESFIISRAAEKSVGNSGGITISAGTLSLDKASGLTATTASTGNAGAVIIRAGDTISLADGSFIHSRVAKNGVGNSGDIDIKTKLFVIDNGELNVGNFGKGNAGNLGIQADFILLNNQGKLTAETISGRGGNIDLQVKNILLMQNNSFISAKASSDANGGNVNIGARFIVAFPDQDNDIIANAKTGNGGNINIATKAIFGLEKRSSTPRNRTNDIDASSEFGLDGNVSINTLRVDPSQGLVNLPTVPVNVEVSQGCQTGGKQSSVAFYNTGKGGIAPNPYEPLSSSQIWEDVPLSSTSASSATVPNKIVEAKGWVTNEKGEVALVAEAPTLSFQGRCHL